MKLTRKQLISLLRGDPVNVYVEPVDTIKQPSLTIGTEMTLRVDAGERPDANQVQRGLDALTADVPSAYRFGFLTDKTSAETKGGKAIPVPGTTAWVAYIVTNADRIRVREVKTSNPTGKDVTYLAGLPPAEQAAQIQQWLAEKHTPEADPHLLRVELKFESREKAKAWQPGEDLAPDDLAERMRHSVPSTPGRFPEKTPECPHCQDHGYTYSGTGRQVRCPVCNPEHRGERSSFAAPTPTRTLPRTPPSPGGPRRHAPGPSREASEIELARGADLDKLAAAVGVERVPASPGGSIPPETDEKLRARALISMEFETHKKGTG